MSAKKSFRTVLRRMLAIRLSLLALVTFSFGCTTPVPPPPPPPAPLALTRITNARSVFISNLGSDNIATINLGGPDGSYQRLVTALQQWGRWKLVSSPNQADMIIEVRTTKKQADITPRGYGHGANAYNSTVYPDVITLTLTDRATGEFIWQIDNATLMPPSKAKDFDFYFNGAIASLVNQLKNQIYGGAEPPRPLPPPL